MRHFLLMILTAFMVCGFAASAVADPTHEPAQVIALDEVEGRIDHMAVDAKAGRLFIAGLGNNTVEVVDMTTGKKLDSIKGFEEPQGLEFLSDVQRLVVASGGDGKCRIYDAMLKLLASIDNLPDADNVRYDPIAKKVFVGFGEGGVALIDPQTGTKVGEIKLDGHPESFQLEKNGRRIFVNVPEAGHVAVIDRDKGAVVARWPITNARSNFPMALDEQSHRLFVGCRKPAMLLVYNTDNGKAVASLKIVGDADDVFYDPTCKKVYVSGGAGQVSLFTQIDADSYMSAGTIETANGARTSLLDASSGTLFVAVPHRGSQKAEIRAFRTTESGK
ncbi:MAG: PQQ-binding-like beta-propeller repeat protein [Candidatus Riflebacteria bacterium]|nr:PQQ-binding-like beta-propeller repeat protein [Candidatus Riflebacteria bacterium]